MAGSLDTADGEHGSLTEATAHDLTQADVAESWQGQAALLLARRIDADQDSGSGLAALVKAHREMMAEALALAPQEEESALSRLRRLREM